MRRHLTRVVISNLTASYLRPSTLYAPSYVRQLSTARDHAQPSEKALSPRWLSDVKMRIGKCIMFGLTTDQTKEACSILQEIALDWRGLVAGSEGFLTEKDRAGLYRQAVVWGEMVSWPRPSSKGKDTAANRECDADIG